MAGGTGKNANPLLTAIAAEGMDRYCDKANITKRQLKGRGGRMVMMMFTGNSFNFSS